MYREEDIAGQVPNSVLTDTESGYAINVPAVFQEPMFWWRDRPDVFERILSLREQAGIQVIDFPDGEPERDEDDGVPGFDSPLAEFDRQQAELRERDPAKADRRESRRPMYEAAEAAWQERQGAVTATAPPTPSTEADPEKTPEKGSRKPVRRSGDGDAPRTA